MRKNKLLTPKDCPLCEKDIYNRYQKDGITKIIPNEFYSTFWVLYDDGSKGAFAVCKDCLMYLDDDKVTVIQDHQRYTWGMEILANQLSFLEFNKQLVWFVNTGCQLKVIKWAKTENGLTA